MLKKPKHSSKKRKIILVIVLLLVVAGITIWVGHSRQWWSGKNASSTRQDDPNKPETRPETSEGQKFDVPAETPKDAIVDYILIKEDERFKIRRNPDTNKYIITLYAIINRPDQYDMYKDSLREYKQAALDYLKGTGVDTTKADITYEPSEATNL